MRDSIFIKASVLLSLFLTWSYLVFSWAPLQRIDLYLYDYFSGIKGENWFFIHTIITHAGDSWFIIPFLFVMGLLLFFLYKNRIGFLSVFFVSLALACNHFVKIFFERQRPLPYVSDLPLTTLAYPSGHALGGILMGFLIWELAKQIFPLSSLRILFPFLLVLCVWIALTRLFLGVHWFSDIVGGVLCACFWYQLFSGVKNRGEVGRSIA
jgi:membrane-associated phospholipid phosphatase